MANYVVDPAVLTAQAEQLTELNGRYKSAIEALVSAETSLSSMWEGDAKEAFHAAFMTDKGKMDEFYNLIMTYISRLQEIATRYSQAEQTNTEIATNRTY